MFEAAEVGRKLSKAEYKAQVPHLRSELLDAQQALRAAPFPVIVLFAGVDTAGKGETVNLLNEWMDPRWIVTRGYTDPSSEELERPRLWRYWRDLPPHGRIALFLSAWYSSPIRSRVAGRLSSAEFDALLAQIAAFERALTEMPAVRHVRVGRRIIHGAGYEAGMPDAAEERLTDAKTRRESSSQPPSSSEPRAIKPDSPNRR